MPPVLFRHPPDDASGITTTRTWLTDILDADDGHEQRVALREVPVTTLSFGINATERGELLRLLGTLESQDNLRFYVPFWPDAVVVYGPVMAGEVLVPADVSDRSFAAGGLAVLVLPDGTMELVAIDTIAGDEQSVTLAAGVVGNWDAMAETLFVPVVIGVLDADLQMEHRRPADAGVTVGFRLEVPIAGLQLIAEGEDGETAIPDVASVVLEILGKGTRVNPGNNVDVPPTWYARVHVHDVLGVPLRAVPIAWDLLDGAEASVPDVLTVTLDPYVVRFDLHAVGNGLKLTATAGAITATRYLNHDQG
jgi:hypothetical protein